jgi:ribose transport system ATP-binding protein
VGENGAGKSTLMKILAGALRADEGEILIDGRKMTISSPKEAELAGIGMVYQELNLVPQLSVSDNIVLGIEPQHGLLLDRASAQRQAASILKELGIDLPLNEPVRNLSVGQQQVVEIAKAMLRRARIIVLDEPTASLSENETTHLFNLIAKLKADGAAVIYISHRLEELAQICQRVTVLRDGRTKDRQTLPGYPARCA